MSLTDRGVPTIIHELMKESNGEGNNVDRQGESEQLIRACINCRHLEVVEEGEEIEGLGDTAFIRTRCKVLDITFTDHYAFPTGEEVLEIEGNPAECPLWEPWDADNDRGRRVPMSEKVLDGVRRDAEEFIAELMKEYYVHMSGQKDTLEIGPIYEKYANLFSLELAHKTRDMMKGTSGLELTGARNFYSFTISEYISNETKRMTEELMNHQSTLKIKVDGEEVSYHGIIPKLRNEGDRDKRKEMYEKWMGLESTELNPLRLDIWGREFEIIEGEGYLGYVPFVQTLTALNYKELARHFHRFLDETREPYIKAMDVVSQETVGIPLSESMAYDKDFMLRGGKYDKYYTKEGLIPAAKKTLADLGLDVDRVEAIILDADEREKKRPRAFCAPVRMGKEVYVVTRPMGGRQDYGSLLHELGHAYHFAYADISLPIELRFFGDRAISEGFAFLFNYLIDDENWLREYLGVSKKDARDVVRFGMANKLFMLRRYIAKLKYELKLFVDWDIENRADEYAATLTEELVIKHYPEAYLYDLDGGFYTADYLRAWFWEVQLRGYLKENFGGKWYANPDCIPTLMELWGWGEQFSPEEMAVKLGMEGLSIEPLMREVRAGVE